MTYSYKQPRRLNIVSLLLLLIVAGAIYLGYKFIPVWWQARKVDQTLDEIKVAAVTFHRLPEERRRAEADKIIARAYAQLYELGIDDHPDQPLQIWFHEDYTELRARYRVDVWHPVIKRTTALTFERAREIPKN